MARILARWGLYSVQFFVSRSLYPAFVSQGDSGGPLTVIVDGQHVLGDVSNGVSKLCATVCCPKDKGLCLTTLIFRKDGMGFILKLLSTGNGQMRPWQLTEHPLCVQNEINNWF